MNRGLSADQRYDHPRGLTHYVRRPAVKWIGLLVAWVIVSLVLSAANLGVLLLLSTVGLMGYCVYSILRDTPPARQQTARQRTSEQVTDWQSRRQFNAPPGWPEPPPGWEPSPDWEPDRSWPPAPPGWQFWVWPDDGLGAQSMGHNGRIAGRGRAGRDWPAGRDWAGE